MKWKGSGSWRLCFVVSALFLLAGGPLHPGGTMAEMLAHPDWVLSHLLQLVSFAALLAGLVLFRKSASLPARTRRWVGLAIIGTVLQVVEMAFHTAASLDHAHLVAGSATPVLSTHLVLAVICYPLFALSIVGLIVAGMRDRVLGSRWIGWLGILGVAAHGAAPVLVVALKIEGARILFPCVLLFAFWLVAVALWPARVPAEGGLTEAPAGT
ncbi:MAG TPA: hypothetical protein VEG34_08850 [Thermoanaerobaculia bacterium]|nr:hypothetical protein [Thermoanaerobaculia bacterium]